MHYYILQYCSMRSRQNRVKQRAGESADINEMRNEIKELKNKQMKMIDCCHLFF